MSKKDYEFIVRTLRALWEINVFRDWVSYKLAVERMADELEIENDRFNREKFIKACLKVIQ